MQLKKLKIENLFSHSYKFIYWEYTKTHNFIQIDIYQVFSTFANDIIFTIKIQNQPSIYPSKFNGKMCQKVFLEIRQPYKKTE